MRHKRVFTTPYRGWIPTQFEVDDRYGQISAAMQRCFELLAGVLAGLALCGALMAAGWFPAPMWCPCVVAGVLGPLAAIRFERQRSLHRAMMSLSEKGIIPAPLPRLPYRSGNGSSGI